MMTLATTQTPRKLSMKYTRRTDHAGERTPTVVARGERRFRTLEWDDGAQDKSDRGYNETGSGADAGAAGGGFRSGDGFTIANEG